MNRNQFKGLANMKNVDALNYAPSNRAKGSLLRREEGGEVCEMDASGKPKRPCKKSYRSRGSSQETTGGVLGTIAGIGAAIGAGFGIKKLRERE